MGKVKQTIRVRQKKRSADKMVCNVCHGTGYQTIPYKKKK